MRAELEQRVVRAGFLVEIDHHWNVVHHRRPAHRGDEFGKAVVD